MQKDRRKFFGTLLAGTASAELLAKIPEPERVARIETPTPNTAYVLEYEGYLGESGVKHIRAAWEMVFGPSAPKLLVLDGNMRLKGITLPFSAKV